jgi:hypothetical protein
VAPPGSTRRKRPHLRHSSDPGSAASASGSSVLALAFGYPAHGITCQSILPRSLFTLCGSQRRFVPRSVLPKRTVPPRRPAAPDLPSAAAHPGSPEADRVNAAPNQGTGDRSGGAAAGGGRSEVKRRRAGASRAEPRTESPLRGGEAGTGRWRSAFRSGRTLREVTAGRAPYNVTRRLCVGEPVPP